jgi:nanoRNase/pAp phosphatase (c-di-AMP/oligoRNAs hydrolase)
VGIPVVDVRTEIGATSTMMIDYLDAAGVEVDARLATALYIGIKTDTDSLERDASRADVDAYTRLLPKVDLSIVRKVMHPPLAEEYYELLLRAIDGAVRYGEALVADVGEVEQPDLLSMVSDLLIEAKGVAWALAIGRHDANVYLSLRIRPPRKNAGHLLRRTVEPEGRGGGHALAAGGRVKSTPERVEITAMQVRERFLQVVGMHQEGPRPFCAEARLRRPDPENARTTGEEGTVAG